MTRTEMQEGVLSDEDKSADVGWLRNEEASAELRDGCGAWSDRRGDDSTAPISLMYLHGFSGSPGDIGGTLNAMRGGTEMALVAVRLPGHGLAEPSALRGISRRDWELAGEAGLEQAIGLGRKVVLCGTSLGGLLALRLASRFPDLVSAVVAWSPAIFPRDRAALDSLASLEERVEIDRRPRNEGHERYWARHVHTDGFRALRDAMAVWTEEIVSRGPTCPVAFGIGEKDGVADIGAMEEVANALQRQTEVTRLRYANGVHALASPYRSPVADTVAADSGRFLRTSL